MRSFLVVAAIAAILPIAGTAQSTLTFDAASVKVVSPGSPATRVGASGPPWREGSGRLHQPSITMKSLLIEAYGVKDFQIVGPGWMEADRFAIDAVMPASTTREQLRVMMQHLLANRFHLAVHRETRAEQVYVLSVAKSGPKLKEIAEGTPVPEPKGDEPEFDPYGFPNPIYFARGRGGATEFQINGRSRITGQHASMKDFIDVLIRRLGRPVSDKTNLTGKYDFVLNYSGTSLTAPVTDAPMPDLFQALQTQLGLKLEARKGPVEMIVVDHVERVPTEN
jgi:uncharacterized protein (TIGR03435 family)